MRYDYAIVGAGIAGAGLAAELALHATVILLEAEDAPGYHSTGRSAAFWHETLGGPLVRPLTRASLATLRDGGFLKPRVSLEVADAASVPLLDALAARFDGSGIKMTRVEAAGVRRWVPRAKPLLVAGLVEEDCADIDVAALHADALARFRRGGGTLMADARVVAAERTASGWTIATATTSFQAGVLIDAAGAWADPLAAVAGVAALGIVPKRRTIVQVRVASCDVPDDLPLVLDIAGNYYFRPVDAERLWLCPHDETPVAAHDVAPEEMDVATAIDRFEAVTDWRVVAVERKWAGLRSFAPDRLPVYGFADGDPSFFWCAGQGGVGIQTAPAAARLCAHLLLGDAVPLPAGVDPAAYSPGRFA